MPTKQKPSRDVAAEITNLIIRKLEEGVAPWSRPWRVSGAGGRPLRHCGTPYTGINVLYLWAIADDIIITITGVDPKHPLPGTIVIAADVGPPHTVAVRPRRLCCFAGLLRLHRRLHEILPHVELLELLAALLGEEMFRDVGDVRQIRP